MCERTVFFCNKSEKGEEEEGKGEKRKIVSG
jgi:hypothetical protein